MRLRSFMFILIVGVVPQVVLADAAELETSFQQVYTNCSGFAQYFNQLKTMAGVNTAITGVGTAAGAGAAIVGFSKKSTDERIEELAREICKKGGCDAAAVEAMSNEDFFNIVLTPMAEIAELRRLEQKSKKQGNWRTGLLAGNTATNIAGAIIADRNKTDEDRKNAVSKCVAAVQEFERAAQQARQDDVDAEKIAVAQTIVQKCRQWQYVDLPKIDNRGNGAMWASIGGAVVGGAGTITSAIANTDKTRKDNTAAGKAKEKNLNNASNVLAVGATVASTTATIFNATQIAAINKAATAAEECEEALMGWY